MRNYIFYQTDKQTAKRPYKVKCRKCGAIQNRLTQRDFTCGFCKNKYSEPHNWGSIKKSLLNKRGEKCEICERKEDIHIHHRDRNRSNNHDENLQILCTHCHQSVHRNWGKKLIDIYKGKFGTRLTWQVALN